MSEWRRFVSCSDTLKLVGPCQQITLNFKKETGCIAPGTRRQGSLVLQEGCWRHGCRER